MADEGNSKGTQGTSGATGDGTPAWVAQLPADMRGDQSFHGFKTIGDLAASHKTLQGQVQELNSLKEYKANGSIPKLQANATDEQRAAFRSALGVPKEPAGYDFKGENLNPKGVEFARNACFKYNIAKADGESLFQDFLGYEKGMVDAAVAQAAKDRSDQETKLKAEWGDKFNERVERSRRYLENAGKEFMIEGKPADVKGFLDRTRFGNDPFLIRFVDFLASKTGEDFSSKGSSGGSGGETGLITLYR